MCFVFVCVWCVCDLGKKRSGRGRARPFQSHVGLLAAPLDWAHQNCQKKSLHVKKRPKKKRPVKKCKDVSRPAHTHTRTYTHTHTHTHTHIHIHTHIHTHTHTHTPLPQRHIKAYTLQYCRRWSQGERSGEREGESQGERQGEGERKCV